MNKQINRNPSSSSSTLVSRNRIQHSNNSEQKLQTYYSTNFQKYTLPLLRLQSKQDDKSENKCKFSLISIKQQKQTLKMDAFTHLNTDSNIWSSIDLDLNPRPAQQKPTSVCYRFE